MIPDLFHSGARVAMAAGPLRRMFTVAVALVALVHATGTAMAHSHSPSGELKDVTIDELKRVYLWCDRASIDGQLSSAAVMQCSVVYEELKQRAFGGDFDKLLAWSRANPSVRNTTQ